MKVFLLLCFVAFARANFFDSVGHAIGDGVKDAAHVVGHGVVDAAHVVGDGLVDAAHAVGGVLTDVGHTLGDTFGDVWNVVQDPLKQAGEKLLVQAAEFAVEQGVEMALGALAAGKRELPNLSQAKAFVIMELHDEYKQWLAGAEHNIMNSRQEMTDSILKMGLDNIPQEMKDYVEGYTTAALRGRASGFVVTQAEVVMKKALDNLKTQLNLRMATALQQLTQA